ncbi:MAG: hypothetical protein B6230_02710 [Desulfobacteraceae bacterium 4572_89]|nr:MAG: hypothetical protein B6230_02710 [Desulfobacteraceae bacterium 4572_89]
MTIIIVAVIFLIALMGFGLLMKRFRADGIKPAEKQEAPSVQSPLKSPEDEFQDILDSLLRLNLMIRKDPNFSKEMTLKIEEIIDDLKVVTPAMMERYPGESLTYEIKKIGLTHLHKTVKEFLDMSIQSRQNQLETFQKTIQSLHDVSHRSRDIVENNETAEFKTMAHFLAGKFS